MDMEEVMEHDVGSSSSINNIDSNSGNTDSNKIKMKRNDYLRLVEEKKIRIDSNPRDYDNYIQLITIMRPVVVDIINGVSPFASNQQHSSSANLKNNNKHDMDMDEDSDDQDDHHFFDELRGVRKLFHEQYPLTEKLWQEWIDDEKMIGELGEEDIMELYNKACNDYSSAALWYNYLTFAIQYLENQGDSFDDPETLKSCRELLDKGCSIEGGHPSKGYQFWNLYLQFENAHGKNPNAIRNLWKRRLREPLDDLEKAWKEYCDWEKAVNEVDINDNKSKYSENHDDDNDKEEEAGEQEENIEKSDSKAQSNKKRAFQNIQNCKPIYEATKELKFLRTPYEQDLNNIFSQNGVERIAGSSLIPNTAFLEQRWLAYLHDEAEFPKKVNSRVGRNQKTGKTPTFSNNRFISLFERAISDCCLSESLWIKYLEFIDFDLKDRELSIKTHERACRNVPWSSRIWVSFSKAFERLCVKREDHGSANILSILDRALVSDAILNPSFGDDARKSNLLNIWIERISLFRRFYLKNNSSELFLNESNIFDISAEYFKKYFPNWSEGLAEIYRQQSLFNEYGLKNIENAKGYFDMAIDLSRQRFDWWLERIQLEMRSEPLDPESIRKIYRKSMDNFKNDLQTSLNLAHHWLDFEQNKNIDASIDYIDDISKRIIYIHHQMTPVSEPVVQSIDTSAVGTTAVAKEENTNKKPSKKGNKDNKSNPSKRERDNKPEHSNKKQKTSEVIQNEHPIPQAETKPSVDVEKKEEIDKPKPFKRIIPSQIRGRTGMKLQINSTASNQPASSHQDQQASIAEKANDEAVVSNAPKSNDDFRKLFFSS